MKKFLALALAALAPYAFADETPIRNLCDTLSLGGNAVIDIAPAYIDETNWYGNPQTWERDSLTFRRHDSYTTLDIEAKTFSYMLPLNIQAACRETNGAEFTYAQWNSSKQWTTKSNDDYATYIYDIHNLKMEGHDSTNTYNLLAFVPSAIPEDFSFKSSELLYSATFDFAFEWWFVGFSYRIIIEKEEGGKVNQYASMKYGNTVSNDSASAYNSAYNAVKDSIPDTLSSIRIQMVKVVLGDSRKLAALIPSSSSEASSSSIAESSSSTEESSSSIAESSSSTEVSSSSIAESSSSTVVSSSSIAESSSSTVVSSSSIAESSSSTVVSSSSDAESSSSTEVSSSSDAESSSSTEASSSSDAESSSSTVVSSSSIAESSSSFVISNVCDTLNSVVNLVPAYIEEINWYGDIHAQKKDSAKTARHGSYDVLQLNTPKFSYELPLSLMASCKETRGTDYKYAAWDSTKHWVARTDTNYATYIYDSRELNVGAYNSTNSFNMLAFVPEAMPENNAFSSNQLLISTTYEFSFVWWYAAASYVESFKGTGDDSLKTFMRNHYGSSIGNDSLKVFENAVEALKVPDTTKSVRVQMIKVVLVDSRKVPEPESSSSVAGSSSSEVSSSSSESKSSSSEALSSSNEESSSSEGSSRLVTTRVLNGSARMLQVRRLDGSLVKNTSNLVPGIYYVKDSEGMWKKMAVLPR